MMTPNALEVSITQFESSVSSWPKNPNSAVIVYVLPRNGELV